MASRLLPRDEAEQLQIEARRNHSRRDGGREELRHVLRHDDARVGGARHRPGDELQHPADRCHPQVPTDDALQIVAAEGHDEREALRQRRQTALPELGVDQIVARSGQAAPQPHPSLQVVPGALPTLEVERALNELLDQQEPED